jgi:hypothetical protein
VNHIVPDALSDTAGVSLFPVTVLLGRHAIVRAVWIGYRPGMETEIERYVDRVLSQEESNVEGRNPNDEGMSKSK